MFEYGLGNGNEGENKTDAVAQYSHNMKQVSCVYDDDEESRVSTINNVLE